MQQSETGQYCPIKHFKQVLSGNISNKDLDFSIHALQPNKNSLIHTVRSKKYFSLNNADLIKRDYTAISVIQYVFGGGACSIKFDGEIKLLLYLFIILFFTDITYRKVLE